MPNTFVNIEKKALWCAMTGLALLKNELAVGPYFSDEYSGDFAQKFAIGRSMVVPLSQRYFVQRNNTTYSTALQNLDRPTTTISMNETATIALEWESIEAALDMERGEERVTNIYMKPAVAYIRQEIETDLTKYAIQNSNMLIGALGTNPGTYDATSAAALQALTEMSCPIDDQLGIFLPPSVNRAVKTSAVTLTNPPSDITKQFRTGFVGHADSFDWYTSNSLPLHVPGVWAGAVSVSGGSQSGASLLVACTSGDTFKAGDKFSIANVNQVNLMTRVPTSKATAGTKVFTIKADVTASGATATLSIYPPIYGPTSHYQNVDALPAGGAQLTLWPGTATPSTKTGKLGIAMHKGAFFIVGKKLEEPNAVEFCQQQTDPDTGLSVRVIRQWDNKTNSMTTRMDTLWGRGTGLAEQESVVIACA